MKTFIATLIMLLLSNLIYGQKYKSIESEITFFSEAPVEDISAFNNEATSIVDIGESKFAFSVPIQGFQFKKSLMQKHFNEKYLESDKFPKATFAGVINGLILDDGEQNVTASGDLTIHGVTQKVELPGSITLAEDSVMISSIFIVKLEDFKIKIPSVLWRNIAEEIEVKVSFNYSPYEIK